MTAITVANSAKMTGLVTDRVTNGNDRTYKLLIVEDASTTSGYTYDLATIDDSVSGIVGPISESYAGVKSATAATWSTTTITVKENGAYKAAFLCY
jgi:hypothetical protein